MKVDETALRRPCFPGQTCSNGFSFLSLIALHWNQRAGSRANTYNPVDFSTHGSFKTYWQKGCKQMYLLVMTQFLQCVSHTAWTVSSRCCCPWCWMWLPLPSPFSMSELTTIHFYWAIQVFLTTNKETFTWDMCLYFVLVVETTSTANSKCLCTRRSQRDMEDWAEKLGTHKEMKLQDSNSLQNVCLG